MPTLNSGETLTIRGNLDASSGTLTLRDSQLSRTKLLQEDLVVYGIPLAQARVWDDLNALLPGTAANDDLAFIEGSYGTDAPTIQTSDGKATTVAQYARFFVTLPPEYVSGETVKIRTRAGMITTVSDATATIDINCYVNDGAGAVGSDLCATAATSINTLVSSSVTETDFTITATSLVPGDVLDIRVTIAITDSATGTAVIGELVGLSLLCDIKG